MLREDDSNGCILVADGDPSRRAFVCDVLGAGGWSTHQAMTGDEAEARMAEAGYSLAILSLDLPRFEAILTIGSRARRRAPVLVYASPERLRDGDRPDVAVRIATPFTSARLVAEVSRLCGAAPAGPQRLMDLFGAERLGDILRGFEEQLASAREELQAAHRRVFAHRLGGLAGTLGLPLLSRAILAIAAGDDSGIADTLRRIGYARDHVRQMIGNDCDH